jgi:hypothetical protein
VHPFGPGYLFEDRHAQIGVSDRAADGIHFRVMDEFLNNGDRPLLSLEVRLPQGPAFGGPTVRVLVDGAEIHAQPASSSDLRRMRASFDPPWKQDERREITSEWDLPSETLARGTIATAPEGFFIADPTALPVWQTPRGAIPHGGADPVKELLTITVPQDFRVLAPGKRRKPARDGNQSAQQFMIDPSKDFRPYVVAGRYQEKVVRTKQGEVRFWTFHPIETQAARTMAERLSNSMKALADFFGPALGKEPGVRVVESPVELPAEFNEVDDLGAIAFPKGVLLDSHILRQPVASEPTLQLAEYELTRTWFGWMIRPSADAQILMGRGVGLFGLVIAAESRGTQERREMIQSLIARYDEARAVAPDRRLMEPPLGYSRAERISTAYRAALFFVALEDLCGRDNLAAAMRDIIYARSGSDTSYEDLRAAIELVSGKDLAEAFRVWLVRSGIPEDFRSRYQKPSIGIRNQSGNDVSDFTQCSACTQRGANQNEKLETLRRIP